MKLFFLTLLLIGCKCAIAQKGNWLKIHADNSSYTIKPGETEDQTLERDSTMLSWGNVKCIYNYDTIYCDTARYNHFTQKAVLTGNVRTKMGNAVIKTDKLNVEYKFEPFSPQNSTKH